TGDGPLPALVPLLRGRRLIESGLPPSTRVADGVERRRATPGTDRRLGGNGCALAAVVLKAGVLQSNERLGPHRLDRRRDLRHLQLLERRRGAGIARMPWERLAAAGAFR